jgi:hypothetical protein
MLADRATLDARHHGQAGGVIAHDVEAPAATRPASAAS